MRGVTKITKLFLMTVATVVVFISPFSEGNFRLKLRVNDGPRGQEEIIKNQRKETFESYDKRSTIGQYKGVIVEEASLRVLVRNWKGHYAVVNPRKNIALKLVGNLGYFGAWISYEKPIVETQATYNIEPTDKKRALQQDSLPQSEREGSLESLNDAKVIFYKDDKKFATYKVGKIMDSLGTNVKQPSRDGKMMRHSSYFHFFCRVPECQYNGVRIVAGEYKLHTDNHTIGVLGAQVGVNRFDSEYYTGDQHFSGDTSGDYANLGDFDEPLNITFSVAPQQPEERLTHESQETFETPYGNSTIGKYANLVVSEASPLGSGSKARYAVVNPGQKMSLNFTSNTPHPNYFGMWMVYEKPKVEESPDTATVIFYNGPEKLQIIKITDITELLTDDYQTAGSSGDSVIYSGFVSFKNLGGAFDNITIVGGIRTIYTGTHTIGNIVDDQSGGPNQPDLVDGDGRQPKITFSFAVQEPTINLDHKLQEHFETFNSTSTIGEYTNPGVREASPLGDGNTGKYAVVKPGAKMTLDLTSNTHHPNYFGMRIVYEKPLVDKSSDTGEVIFYHRNAKVQTFKIAKLIELLGPEYKTTSSSGESVRYSAFVSFQKLEGVFDKIKIVAGARNIYTDDHVIGNLKKVVTENGNGNGSGNGDKDGNENGNGNGNKDGNGNGNGNGDKDGNGNGNGNGNKDGNGNGNGNGNKDGNGNGNGNGNGSGDGGKEGNGKPLQPEDGDGLVPAELPSATSTEKPAPHSPSPPITPVSPSTPIPTTTSETEEPEKLSAGKITGTFFAASAGAAALVVVVVQGYKAVTANFSAAKSTATLLKGQEFTHLVRSLDGVEIESKAGERGFDDNMYAS